MNSSSVVEQTLQVLGKYRWPLNNEAEFHRTLETKLHEHELQYIKWHRLDKTSIPDLFLDGIVLELKIHTKETAQKIYKQCERYCSFGEVREIILVTNKAMGLPETINGKPARIINIGKALL